MAPQWCAFTPENVAKLEGFLNPFGLMAILLINLPRLGIAGFSLRWQPEGCIPDLFPAMRFSQRPSVVPNKL
jgi:hypothetical protein